METKVGMLILALVGLQRLAELRLANINARWACLHGGVEAGKEHYPWVAGVHGLFFVGGFMELYCMKPVPPSWWVVPFTLFMMAQGLRVWSIASLGPYWNTRIWVVPGHPPVMRGPYRWLRHPNYVVVMVELLCLPLLLGAVYTAVAVTVINSWLLLTIRIPAEERALTELTTYQRDMEGTHRWFFWRSPQSEQ
ncbi:hypothetical protein GCM10011571_05670 [Marinithermofilum abyssi]|uniref:Isoprenylcysteine carboxyl methyltransferase n=1 Tax=Marinithermofilum abyssi TaxID=1571185 RepID=A0A8J2VCH4_9BACL|nr:isoprenylcysteine carboxylmethyltransferase family protein [Marinithermofilum abyssi]GGE07292.1 hypothetical protein GCM10011571_05670 [Marinithermofilum abyssi]